MLKIYIKQTASIFNPGYRGGYKKEMSEHWCSAAAVCQRFTGTKGYAKMLLLTQAKINVLQNRLFCYIPSWVLQ
jgi:hypothetical protein